MQIHSRSPALSAANLKRVLDAARAARPLPATPLRAFALLEQRLADPSVVAGSAAADLTLLEWLNDEIVEGLRGQRAHYHLPPPDVTMSLERAVEALASDFRQGAAELEAWSLLFMRYVRVDLDLPWERLEAITGQDQRTLRRRQDRGLRRLMHRLIQHEQTARREAHRNRLRRTVPPLPGHEIVGRAVPFNQAWSRLMANTSRRHVALTGPGGIGKTALALLLTHRLIDEADLDSVIWLIASQSLTPADLSARCAEALALPSGDGDALRACCQSWNVLIVLDEADSLFDDEPGMAAFLSLVAEARLLLTSRLTVTGGLDLFAVELPELSKGDAQAIVTRVWTEDRALEPERWRLIWRQAGGNPLALEVAARLAARVPRHALESVWPQTQFPDQITLLDNLYERAWNQLDPAARRFWLAAWLLHPHSILHDLVSLVGGLSPAQAAQAAQQLGRLSLLNLDANGNRYRLHSVARAFLRQKVNTRPDVAGWAHEGALRLREALPGSPYAALLAYHLLDMADVLALAPTWCVEAIRAVWANITRQGMWTTWRPLLERLIAWVGEVSPDVRAALHCWLGVACRWTGSSDLAEQYLNLAAQLAAEADDLQGQVSALVELGVVYRYQRRYAQARLHVQQAAVIFQQLRNLEGEHRCRLELARLALDEQQPALALEQLRELPVSAHVAALACDAHLALGNFRQALVFAERALSLAVGDRPNLARAQATVGRTYLAMGRLDEAEDYLSAALSLLEQGQDVLGWARAAGALARVYHLQGRIDEARPLLEAAAAQQRVIRDQVGLFTTLQTTLAVGVDLTARVLESADKEHASDLAAWIRRIDAEWRTLANVAQPEIQQQGELI
jgi:tetratricopeptide (TPR) repeat protein